MAFDDRHWIGGAGGDVPKDSWQEQQLRPSSPRGLADEAAATLAAVAAAAPTPEAPRPASAGRPAVLSPTARARSPQVFASDSSFPSMTSAAAASASPHPASSPAAAAAAARHPHLRPSAGVNMSSLASPAGRRSAEALARLAAATSASSVMSSSTMSSRAHPGADGTRRVRSSGYTPSADTTAGAPGAPLLMPQSASTSPLPPRHSPLLPSPLGSARPSPSPHHLSASRASSAFDLDSFSTSTTSQDSLDLAPFHYCVTCLRQRDHECLLADVLPQPFLECYHWPCPQSHADAHWRWLADLADDPPTASVLLPAAGPADGEHPLPLVLSHGKLCDLVHTYYSRLEWRGWTGATRLHTAPVQPDLVPQPIPPPPSAPEPAPLPSSLALPRALPPPAVPAAALPSFPSSLALPTATTVLLLGDADADATEAALLAALRCAHHPLHPDLPPADASELLAYARLLPLLLSQAAQSTTTAADPASISTPAPTPANIPRALVRLSTQVLEARAQSLNRGRSFLEMAVLELVRQLGVLQSNAHDFYRPAAFASRNAYGRWRECEVGRLRSLIARLWPGSPPVSHADDYGDVHNHHHLYRQLAHVCLAVDEALDTRFACSRRQGRWSRLLLDEYALQFGVGRLSQCIVELDAMRKLYQNTEASYANLTAGLERLIDALKQSPELGTTPELDLMRAVSSALHAKAREALINLQVTFPNNCPPGALRGLLRLVDALRSVDRLIGGGVTSPGVEMAGYLQSLLGLTLDSMYKRISGEQDKQYSLENSASTSMMAQRLLDMLHAAKREVDNLRRHFKADFARFKIDIVTVAADFLYNLLSSELHNFCLVYLGNKVSSINPHVLALAHGLHELDTVWSPYLPPRSYEPWRKELTAILLRWFEVVQNNHDAWVAESMRTDDLEPMYLADDPHSTAAVVPISSSLIDVIFITSRTLGFLRSLMLLLQSSSFSAYRSSLGSVFSSSDAEGNLSSASSASPAPASILSQSASQRQSLLLRRVTDIVQTTLRDFALGTLQPVLADLPARTVSELEDKFSLTLGETLERASLAAEARNSRSSGGGGGGGGNSRPSRLARAVSEGHAADSADPPTAPYPWNRLLLRSDSTPHPTSQSSNTPHRPAPAPAPAPALSAAALAAASTTSSSSPSLLFNARASDTLSESSGSTISLAAASTNAAFALKRRSISASMTSPRKRMGARRRSVDEPASPMAQLNPRNMFRPSTTSTSGSNIAAGLPSAPESIDTPNVPDRPSRATRATSLPAMELDGNQHHHVPRTPAAGTELSPTGRGAAHLSTSDTLSKVQIENITRDMCMRINNVYTLAQALPALGDVLAAFSLEVAGVWREGGVHELLPGAEPYLESLAACMLDMLCYRMNVFVKPALRLLLEKLRMSGLSTEQRLRPVLRFIRNQLRAMSEWLLPPLLRDMVLAMWDTIHSQFRRMVLGRSDDDIHDLAPGTALVAHQALSYLVSFFQSGYPELAPSFARSAESTLRLFKLCTLNTADLIEVFYRCAMRAHTELTAGEDCSSPPPHSPSGGGGHGASGVGISIRDHHHHHNSNDDDDDEGIAGSDCDLGAGKRGSAGGSRRGGGGGGRADSGLHSRGRLGSGSERSDLSPASLSARLSSSAYSSAETTDFNTPPPPDAAAMLLAGGSGSGGALLAPVLEDEESRAASPDTTAAGFTPLQEPSLAADESGRPGTTGGGPISLNYPLWTDHDHKLLYEDPRRLQSVLMLVWRVWQTWMAVSGSPEEQVRGLRSRAVLFLAVERMLRHLHHAGLVKDVGFIRVRERVVSGRDLVDWLLLPCSSVGRATPTEIRSPQRINNIFDSSELRTRSSAAKIGQFLIDNGHAAIVASKSRTGSFEDSPDFLIRFALDAEERNVPAELDYSKPLLYVTSLGDPWATADNVLGVLYKRTGDPMARRFAFHIMHL